jgi:hypothetical protein
VVHSHSPIHIRHWVGLGLVMVAYHMVVCCLHIHQVPLEGVAAHYLHIRQVSLKGVMAHRLHIHQVPLEAVVAQCFHSHQRVVQSSMVGRVASTHHHHMGQAVRNRHHHHSYPVAVAWVARADC